MAEESEPVLPGTGTLMMYCWPVYRENRTAEEEEPALPEAGAAEEEHLNSMSIFFSLAILGETCRLVRRAARGKSLR